MGGSSSAYVNQTDTWQNQLAIDFGDGGVSTFSYDDLQECNRNIAVYKCLLNDFQENIRNIAVYKCPLNDFQKIQLFDNHQFVILETDNWWYSIEKNDHYIYMQRRKHIDDVVCYRRNNPRRTPILGISFDCCQPGKTMGDLIQFLCDKNELNNRYDPILSNCQAFTKRIFDEFAGTKKHEIVFGCSLPTIQVIPPWQKRPTL